MKALLGILTLTALCGCSWEFYQNNQGGTSMRPKYPTGTPVYYQDGNYSHDMRYHQFRPEAHTLNEKARIERQAHDMHGIHWQDGTASNVKAPE